MDKPPLEEAITFLRTYTNLSPDKITSLAANYRVDAEYIARIRQELAALTSGPSSVVRWVIVGEPHDWQLIVEC